MSNALLYQSHSYLNSLSGASWLRLYRSGEADMSAGRVKEAIKKLNAALQCFDGPLVGDPRRIVVLDLLSKAYAKNGSPQSAADLLHHSIAYKVRELGPHSQAVLDSYSSLADLYERQGLWEKAARLRKLEASLRRCSAGKVILSAGQANSRESQSQTLPPGTNLRVAIKLPMMQQEEKRQFLASNGAYSRNACA